MIPMRSVALFAALLTSTSYAQDPQFASCHFKAWPGPSCDAAQWPALPQLDSSNNPCGLFGGDAAHAIQAIPLGSFLPDTPNPGKVYVAYSTTINTSTLQRKNNVLMTVFELACNEEADLLVFGTGYGCRGYGEAGLPPTSQSEFGAEHDAGLIDDIVRGCMKLQGSLEVDFVVPHGHPDHFNPEFIKALNSLPGYTIGTIWVHTDDRAHLLRPNQACVGSLPVCECPDPCEDDAFSCWDVQVFGEADCCDGAAFGPPEDPGSCESMPQLDCEDYWEDPMLDFNTTVGKVWFRSRDGHTPGSVDLVLDHKSSNPPTDPRRFVIYGSMIPNCKNGYNCVGLCTPACSNELAGLLWSIPAHGNLTELAPEPSCPPPSCPPCAQEDISCSGD